MVNPRAISKELILNYCNSVCTWVSIVKGKQTFIIFSLTLDPVACGMLYLSLAWNVQCSKHLDVLLPQDAYRHYAL